MTEIRVYVLISIVLCHYHQHITGVYGTGETGSSTENEANVRSGIIMRNFDSAHPEVFKMPPL